MNLYTCKILNSNNYGNELFGSEEIKWIVDDRLLYRVKLTDAMQTKAVNGVLFVFNPKTGMMFVKVILGSYWEGVRNCKKVTKLKASEEICNLVNALPKEDHPKEIFVIRKSLIDTLENNLKDFKEIKIQRCDLMIRFNGLLKMKEFKKKINNVTQPSLLLFNLYDDWYENISSYTCFSRLLLLIRSYDIDVLQTESVLNKTISEPQPKKKKESNIWNSYEDDKWIQIEVKLKGIVISDYCNKMNKNSNSLNRGEIRDIILGMKM